MSFTHQQLDEAWKNLEAHGGLDPKKYGKEHGRHNISPYQITLRYQQELRAFPVRGKSEPSLRLCSKVAWFYPKIRELYDAKHGWSKWSQRCLMGLHELRQHVSGLAASIPTSTLEDLCGIYQVPKYQILVGVPFLHREKMRRDICRFKSPCVITGLRKNLTKRAFDNSGEVDCMLIKIGEYVAGAGVYSAQRKPIGVQKPEPTANHKRKQAALEASSAYKKGRTVV